MVCKGCRMNILIIGYGIVGKNIQMIFCNADAYDKNFSDERKERVFFKKYDIAFICVPTDKKEDGSCDTSKVKAVIKYFKKIVDVFCIKSTIPPGTTERICNEIYPRVVFSPEYFGNTQHANGVDYNFVILGGARELTGIVASAFEKKYNGDLKIIQTDSKTAELVKYGENAWLAAKVTFCNEFARICQAFGVDYREWRELWLQDPRINRSHTFVYEDAPYYDSHCLNKDVPAIIEASRGAGYQPGFIQAIENYNNFYRGK